MKTLLRSLTLLLVFTLLLSTNALAKSENAKLSLVSLGDSIPYGYNLGHNNNSSTSKHAFPYLIGADADMRVRNLAVPGWKTDQLLEAVMHDQKYRQAIRHADYMTLTIGNNDLLQALDIAARVSGGDPDSFILELNNEIEKSQVFEKLVANIVEIRSLSDAPVVVYNVYNPFQKNDPLYDVGMQVLTGINEQLKHLISNIGYDNLVIADAFTAFANNQATYVIDQDIHPTVEGQRKLADIGLKALEFNN